MVLLRGFFSVLWGPMAAAALAGIALLLLSVRRNGVGGRELPLLVLILFGFCALWRIPLLSVERYALPLAIPGALLMAALAVFSLEYRKKYSELPIRTVLLVLTAALAVGIPFKALRPRKAKPQLAEITRIVESARGGGRQRILLLSFGNQGGVLSPEGVDVHVVRVGDAEMASRRYARAISRLAGPMSLWRMRACYDRVFIACAEGLDPQFRGDWAAVYGETLEPRYELLLERKKRGYRLYELSRTVDTAIIWRDSESMRNFFRTRNLVENGDFKETCEITPKTPFVEALAKRGYSFFRKEEFRFPAGWEFNPKLGFRKHFWSDFRFRFKEDEARGNSCEMVSNTWVSLWNTGKPLAAGRYAALVLGRNTGDTYAAFSVACRGRKNGKITLRGNSLLPRTEGEFETVIPLEIPQRFTGRPMISLYNGILSVSGVFIVPMEAIEKIPEAEEES